MTLELDGTKSQCLNCCATHGIPVDSTRVLPLDQHQQDFVLYIKEEPCFPKSLGINLPTLTGRTQAVGAKGSIYAVQGFFCRNEKTMKGLESGR